MMTAELFEDGLMKVREVAKFLSVHESTVWRLIKDGKIESVKFGGSRRIPRKAAIKYAGREIESSRSNGSNGDGSSNANEDV